MTEIIKSEFDFDKEYFQYIHDLIYINKEIVLDPSTEELFNKVYYHILSDKIDKLSEDEIERCFRVLFILEEAEKYEFK